ncbi:Uncharacterised protein [Vibrio cholerae]|nr:Uncharacterised protein [Vibrio cholerae]
MPAPIGSRMRPTTTQNAALGLLTPTGISDSCSSSKASPFCFSLRLTCSMTKIKAANRAISKMPS